MSQIISLCKFELKLKEADGSITVFPPLSSYADLSFTDGTSLTINGIPVEVKEFAGVVGVPDPHEDVYYIVPITVAHHEMRPDLLRVNFDTEGFIYGFTIYQK